MVLASAFGALLLFNSIYKYGYTNTHIYNVKYTYYFITYVYIYICIYIYIHIGISFSAGPDSWDPPISPKRVGAQNNQSCPVTINLNEGELVK